MKKLLCALLIFGTGCSAKVPDVAETAFACEDDFADEDGNLPCPQSHWCTAVPGDDYNACTPRLGCNFEAASRPGCDPDRKCELLSQVDACYRCELRTNVNVAAVTCAPGLYTETSTRPLSLDPCTCPKDQQGFEELSCVAFGEGQNGEAYPLYLLPAGTKLPSSIAELPDRRMCTRVCSSELDCPASHTCRPAAVLTPAFLADPGSARSTVGVCYPDRLTSTSTITPIEQPEETSCTMHEDCTTGAFEPCRFRTVTIPDHPRAPIGAVWGEHRAVITRCSSGPSGMRGAGQGCSSDNECRSGLCVSSRCAKPCNPEVLDACDFNQDCADVLIKRTVNGVEFEDRAQICPTN